MVAQQPEAGALSCPPQKQQDLAGSRRLSTLRPSPGIAPGAASNTDPGREAGATHSASVFLVPAEVACTPPGGGGGLTCGWHGLAGSQRLSTLRPSPGIALGADSSTVSGGSTDGATCSETGH
eukprot:15467462-Alexandrium_andersonii.AAC.1